MVVGTSDKSSLVARYFISLQAVNIYELILIQQTYKLVFIPWISLQTGD